jgi:hypothetical protein
MRENLRCRTQLWSNISRREIKTVYRNVNSTQSVSELALAMGRHA